MKAHVRTHNGTPTLFLDGKPCHASFLLTGHQTEPEGLDPTQRIMGEYRDAGVHLYSYDVVTQHEMPGPRPGHPEPWDFSRSESRFRKFLDVDPNAHFLVRMGFEMRWFRDNWWGKAHPDEVMITSDGRSQTQSLASLVWRDLVNAYLKAWIAHLREVGLYERVIAYQIAAGSAGEWIESECSMMGVTPDYSEPMRKHFRAWLRRRYDSDVAKLREAWASPSADFDTAQVPPASRQLGTTKGHFRDPRAEGDVVDFYRCLAELAADDLLEFCATVKKETGPDKLTGAFFGYLMDIAWNVNFFADKAAETSAWDAIRESGDLSTYQRSGHLGLRWVLQSPHIDFLVSPYSYGFRGIGGDGLPMQPGESVRHHGKIYLMEEDTRMHNNFDPDGRMHPWSQAPAIYRRNFAQCLTHGHGITWMQDSLMDDPPEGRRPYYELLARTERIGSWALGLDRTPASEVAVFLDTQSFFYQTVRNVLDLAGISWQKLTSLNRFGAPHDVYLLDDLVAGTLPPYKLYVFLNPWRVDAKRRAAIRGIVRRAGRTALWLYAPGYLDQAASLEGMHDLTGMRLAKTDNPWSARMHITDFRHPVTQSMAQDHFWGSTVLSPVFYLDDPDASVLGQVVHTLGRCKPGLAVKELPAEGGGTWKTVYLSTPDIPAALLRGVARWAGVHLYNDAGDVLYATKDLLSVHTVSGGERLFRLPRMVEVVHELYDDRRVAEDADSFRVTLEPASTALWFTGDRETLRKLR